MSGREEAADVPPVDDGPWCRRWDCMAKTNASNQRI